MYNPCAKTKKTLVKKVKRAKAEVTPYSHQQREPREVTAR
jgi:hypothetical protein